MEACGMAGSLVVKDNALIEASHKLTEIEQRLVLLAVLKARGHCDKVEQLRGQELIIHADEYAQTFGSTRQGSYKALKQAVLGLFRAEWGYKYINAKGNKVVRYERFTQSAEYIEKEATVSFRFSDAIIPMLVELERCFTTYEVEQIAKLSSGYAMRLYEFFMQYFDKKSGRGVLDISLEDLRFRLGLLPNEYERMGNFKSRVLDYSISEINKHTNLIASYSQKKNGRSIIGFCFEFQEKNQGKHWQNKKIGNQDRDANIPDMFDNLTDEERKIVDNINAYADQRSLTDLHRKNLIKKSLEENKKAKEERKNRKNKEVEQLELQNNKQEENRIILEKEFRDFWMAIDEGQKIELSKKVGRKIPIGYERSVFLELGIDEQMGGYFDYFVLVWNNHYRKSQMK